MRFYTLLLLQFFFIYNLAVAQHRVNTICIDAGHGGKDPGVVYGKLKEKDFALKIAKILGSKINNKYPKIKIYYTRLSDKFVRLSRRAHIANKYRADLFISIHINSNSKSTARGSMSIIWGASKRGVRIYNNVDAVLKETIINEGCEKDVDIEEKSSQFSTLAVNSLPKRNEFASLCEQRLKSETKRYSYGVKHANFAVLRLTQMPAVLIEVGFITNYADRKYITSKQGQNTIANAIFNAFRIYKDGKIRRKSNFFIQIAASRTADKKRVADLQNVQIKYKAGWYKYVLTGFSTKEQAQKRLKQIRNIPKYKGAFIIKAF